MRKVGLRDKNGKEMYEGQTIKYRGREFDVIFCNGSFKFMETKSMFEGAVDFWLHEILPRCMCKMRKIKFLEIIKK